MKVDFRRLTWENYPSTETPINADNLNRLEEGVAGLYSDVAEIEQELGGGVGEYVTDWLNEHVDPVGSAVVVDDTLSIEGAAADAKKTGDEISSLKEDLTAETEAREAADDEINTALETKANIDGYYEDMTVGDAEQLVASQYVEDSVPYQFRTTGGSADVGNREYADGIVGGTVAWNQLVQNGDFEDSSNWAGALSLSISDGVATYTATGRYDGVYQVFPVGYPKDHVYFMHTKLKTSTATDQIQFLLQGSTGTACSKYSASTTEWQTVQSIEKSTMEIERVSVRDNRADVHDSYQITDVYVVDLTQMFGSTIADYIYSLETATAGAGVAWFEKLFPNMDAEYSYHEDSFDEESPLITKKLRDYQPGILLSIEGLVSHDTVGFNQFDKSTVVKGRIDNGSVGYAFDVTDLTITDTGVRFTTNNGYRGCTSDYIRVIPKLTYFISMTSSPSDVVPYVDEYDAEKNWIRRNTLNGQYYATIHENTKYVRLSFQKISAGTVSINDICLKLSWSGTHNGEYQPYEKHSYPLDSTVVLRGFPKLDSNNELYYDGDRYLPDGTVTHYWKEVTYNGSEEWAKDTNTNGYCRFYHSDNSIKVLTDYRGNIINSRGYGTANSYGISYNPTDDVLVTGYPISGSANWVYIAVKESMNISTVDAFKAWLAQKPVTLVLQLATPTTETAEPYQEVQICNDWGTEEFVSTSIVPVGHETRYPANLRDKLQHLPDLADDDGYYMIGQSNKQMHLELFRIPKAPTTDGTYTLKATVSGGTPTYTWEAQT